jgi:hypothetical protein
MQNEYVLCATDSSLLSLITFLPHSPAFFADLGHDRNPNTANNKPKWLTKLVLPDQFLEAWFLQSAFG